MSDNKKSLKQRFLNAIHRGDLGTLDDYGVTVTVKACQAYFKDIKTQCTRSFLREATIEQGQMSVTRTKYLFRIGRGVYRIHPEVLKKNSFKIKSCSNIYTISSASAHFLILTRPTLRLPCPGRPANNDTPA